MGSFSIVHWLIVGLVWWLVIGFPASRILKRVGFSAWWSLVMLAPLVNVIALWVFAFVPWKDQTATK